MEKKGAPRRDAEISRDLMGTLTTPMLLAMIRTRDTVIFDHSDHIRREQKNDPKVRALVRKEMKKMHIELSAEPTQDEQANKLLKIQDFYDFLKNEFNIIEDESSEFTIDVSTLMRLIKSEDPELYVLGPSITEVHRTDPELRKLIADKIIELDQQIIGIREAQLPEETSNQIQKFVDFLRYSFDMYETDEK
jgi:hypothetical protein